MTRLRNRLLVVCGVMLTVAGFWLLTANRVSLAQPRTFYVGSDECGSCHRTLTRAHSASAHSLALSRDDEAIRGDFRQGESVRTVTLPGEDAARPFTADDIAYTVGAGKYIQQYLFEYENDRYYVLPAQWNVAERQWEALNLGAAWPDPAYDWNQNCAYCHVTGLDVEAGEWEEAGVQCEACHGPGSEHLDETDSAGRNPDDEELALIRESINPAVDPQVCGQCHARGVSGDGHPFPVGYVPGMELGAAFTLDDGSAWYPSGHARTANMQYSEWLTSGHASSLANLLQSGAEVEAECLTCHSADYVYTERLRQMVESDEREGSAPDSLTPQTAQYGITCTACHNPHADAERPTNLVEERYALCVSCHSTANFNGEGVHHPVREMYEGSTLIPQVRSRASDHFLEPGGPDCQTCHLVVLPILGGSSRASHSLRPVLPDDAATMDGVIDTCTTCHEDQVDAATMQALIDVVQADARARIEAARAAVNAGTPPWVTQVLDFVEGDGSYGIHNYAYADELLDAAFAELGLFQTAGG
jgi:predicted CXXCH cytochrome family protein